MVVKYSLGIDISSGTFDSNLSVIDSDQNVKVIATHKFANTQNGFAECHKWITKHWKQKDIRLVMTMEATGVYYENSALFLFRKGYTVAVVLPNKAKKYMQSTGLKSKNDKIDAKGLARMGAEQSLKAWEPMTEFFYQLRKVTRQHTGKTRISKKGNSRIRRALHMPAFSVVRWEQKPFFNLFKRTLEKHNIKMKSYVAVQKKLLVVTYALWKKNEEYDNNYLAIKCNTSEEQMKK